MPTAQPTIVISELGAVLAIVKGDGTVDVWNIPRNATITIQPAAGFGSVAETSTAASLANAEADINAQLVHDGAV